MQKSRLSLFLLATLLLFGCKQTPKAPLIERNKEVNEYFVTLNELVDEYCDMIETTINHAKDIDLKEKNGEEASIMDGFEMLTDMAGSAYKISKLAEKIEGMEEQHERFEKDLSADDFEEFLAIYSKAIKRFVDIAKKAESLEDN